MLTSVTIEVVLVQRQCLLKVVRKQTGIDALANADAFNTSYRSPGLSELSP